MNGEILDRLERENIELATVNKRGWAYFIDEIIVSILFSFIYWDHISGAKTPEEMILVINTSFYYVVLLKIIYQTFFVWQYGATPGKMFLKIQIIDRNIFEKPSFISALNRAVVRIFSEMFFYLGFIWAFLNPLKETWHDKLAKTLVIDV